MMMTNMMHTMMTMKTRCTYDDDAHDDAHDDEQDDDDNDEHDTKWWLTSHAVPLLLVCRARF